MEIAENAHYAAQEQERRNIFAQTVHNVDRFVEDFRGIPDNLIVDELFMERFIMEKVGLNNENLHEQPQELYTYCGTGLYMWQNPKQFSKLIIWLINNARQCRTFFEIGCRWGGTFIVLCETLRRASPGFNLGVAVDPIEMAPFISRYRDIAAEDRVQIGYFRGYSGTKEFADVVVQYKPDVTFIDGDHSCFGALRDHMLVREYSDIIIHHDISSDACVESTFLWSCLKKLDVKSRHIEFVEQYPDVAGSYLGIGVSYTL